jgi:5-methylcytosine-specific restriction endonuclease McrA
MFVLQKSINQMSRFRRLTGRYADPEGSRYAQYIRARAIDGRDNNALANHNAQLPEKHGSYGYLLFDPRWKERRKQILERDNSKCVICSSTSNLEVHHRQYHFIGAVNQFKPPWEYADHLMITLCNRCHQRGHAKFKVPTIII